MKIIILFMTMLLIPSCKGSFNGVIKKRHTAFGFNPPAHSWRESSFRGSDLYFEHSDQNAYIFINSQCQNLSDSPLSALTEQMLVGFSDVHYIKQSSLDIAQREALISEIEAKIDGVKRYLKIFVLKKNLCVYDMVFSMKDPPNVELIKDFDQMINSFWAQADL